MASIRNYPLFGIGLTDYVRPVWMVSSVDAHFLLLGMRHGIITPVFMLLALIYTMIWLGRRAIRSDKQDRNLAVGLNFSLGLLLLSGMTVTYFFEANIWFMAIMGIGVSIASMPFGSRFGQQPGYAPPARYLPQQSGQPNPA